MSRCVDTKLMPISQLQNIGDCNTHRNTRKHVCMYVCMYMKICMYVGLAIVSESEDRGLVPRQDVHMWFKGLLQSNGVL
jgi:hypothetical protein